MSRTVQYRYEDPLDAIWLATAESMGLRIVRSKESYASTDGLGTLSLSDRSGMDADDCLAQMILHEICHSLVQGSESFGWVDWGLDNEGERDVEREHACLRLQAALLDPWGLRQTLGSTTDFREYYDNLPPDPFVEREPSEREAIVRARAAYARRRSRPWNNRLQDALEASSAILQSAARFPALSKRKDSLLRVTTPPRAQHHVGSPLHHDAEKQCGQCAWLYDGGPGKAVSRCQQHGGSRVKKEERACEQFEPIFDCLGCGACCREAYDTVEVSPRDPARKLHLKLMVERAGGYDMLRGKNRCSCLKGGIELTTAVPAILGGNSAPDAGERTAPLAMPGAAPFTCDIYETRPRTCRDFTIFSENCLHARRKVGLSR